MAEEATVERYELKTMLMGEDDDMEKKAVQDHVADRGNIRGIMAIWYTRPVPISKAMNKSCSKNCSGQRVEN